MTLELLSDRAPSFRSELLDYLCARGVHFMKCCPTTCVQGVFKKPLFCEF